MSPLLEFTIPGNPGDGAVNRSRGYVKGRYIKSRCARSFAALAERRCFEAFALRYSGDAKVPTEVSVVIRCYWPRRRKLDGTTTLPMGDVDAPIKAVLDSLEDAELLDDDARVRRVSCEKFLDRDNPRIEVEVWPVDIRPSSC